MRKGAPLRPGSNLLDLDGTTQETSPARSDETNFLTRHGVAVDRRRLTNVLVVTTTVRVVNRVHGNTTSAGPVVTLSLELVERTTGLKQGLVDTTTTGDNADRGTRAAHHSLLRARRKTDAGLALLGRVANDGRVVAGGTGERTTVTDLLLNVADDGTFRALREGENVADGESGLLASVDERASVEALSGDESLRTELVAVRVTEDDAGEGGTTTSVVNDLLNDATDVAVALSKVEDTETRRRLVVVGVRTEDGVRATLSPNNPTHCL